MVRLSAEFKEKGFDAQIVACIQDSIWIETAVKEERDIREIIERVMTTAISLSVPLHVDVET